MNSLIDKIIRKHFTCESLTFDNDNDRPLFGGIVDACKKYELLDDVKNVKIVTDDVGREHELHRIRAIIDIPEIGIMAGDLGGFIESESNLSQFGDCWIGAKEFAAGTIYGNVTIKDDARIDAHSHIYTSDSGRITIGGNSKIADLVIINAAGGTISIADSTITGSRRGRMGGGCEYAQLYVNSYGSIIMERANINNSIIYSQGTRYSNTNFTNIKDSTIIDSFVSNSNVLDSKCAYSDISRNVSVNNSEITCAEIHSTENEGRITLN